MLHVQAFTRRRRQSDVFKELRDIDYVCDSGVIPAGSQANGSPNFEIGTVLGRQTVGAISVAAPAAASGNAGDGTCTLGSPAYDVGVRVGNYRAIAISPTEWQVFDPDGELVGIAADSQAFADQIHFTVTHGATPFAAGDAFTIVVSAAAASGAYVQLDPAADDGSENFAGIVALGVTVDTANDTPATIATRGPTMVVADNLTWPTGISATAQAAALAQMSAVGIKAIPIG
jgi:hypothetical protein